MAVRVRVRVEPDSKREVVTKVGEEMFHIVVREPRTENRANVRIRELIAREYGVLPTHVRILTGHRSSSKLVEVEV